MLEHPLQPLVVADPRVVRGMGFNWFCGPVDRQLGFGLQLVEAADDPRGPLALSVEDGHLGFGVDLDL